MAKKKAPKKLPKKLPKPKKAPKKRKPKGGGGNGGGKSGGGKKKQLTYKGVLLSEELSDKIRLLWKDLIFVGCFYSYNKVISLLFEHIRYYLFYRKEPNSKYPCEKEFNKVALKYFNIDMDEYLHNQGITEIEEFRDRMDSQNMIMYFRSMQGALKRFKSYAEYHDRITTEYSVVWKSVWDFIYDNPEVESPILSVWIGKEEVTGTIFIDFYRDSNITGIPLNPTVIPYSSGYYAEAGVE